MYQANREEVKKMLQDFLGSERWEKVMTCPSISNKISTKLPHIVLHNDKVMVSPIKVKALKQPEEIVL